MKISRDQGWNDPDYINVGDMIIRKAETYKYLARHNFNRSNTVSEEIKSRVQIGNKIYFALQQLLKSKILSQNTKITIYKTIIRPTVTRNWCHQLEREDKE